MAVVGRILMASFLTAWLGVGVGKVLFGGNPEDAWISFVLACVAAVVGAVAGAGREVAAAVRSKNENP